jgi:hypothetical protein
VESARSGVGVRRGLKRLRRVAVVLWESGQLEGRRTFVGLTVHGHTEGRLESHLQSSPAEGMTVTKAEVKPRGDHIPQWGRRIGRDKET